MNKFNVKDMEDKMLKICNEILDEKWDSSCNLDCSGIKCENCFFGDTFEDCNNRDTEMFKLLAKSYKDKHSIIINESNMKKIFKGWEIIKMIAEGELKNGDVIIEDDGSWAYTILQNCLVDGRNVKEFDSKLESGNSNFCSNNHTYIIKKSRKKYTFEEAFKAYEEGKEIESCVSGAKFTAIDSEHFQVILGGSESIKGTFEVKEIRGMWHINNK